MVPHKATTLIVSPTTNLQGTTYAVCWVLAEFQHELQDLFRKFTETTVRMVLQENQRSPANPRGTAQNFEEDDVINDGMFAKKHDQPQQKAANNVKDFIGAPVYDVYDDELYTEPIYDLYREAPHKSKETTPAGEQSLQRTFLSPISISEIDDGMERETLIDGLIFTNDLENYYVPVKDVADEPIYTVIKYEVFGRRTTTRIQFSMMKI